MLGSFVVFTGGFAPVPKTPTLEETMRRKLVLLGTIAALFAIPWSAMAQRTTGDIRGVVTDQSGAVLPGVTVTLRGPNVAGTPTTVTNESGIYRFPNLAPGTYDIKAELQGFTGSTQTGIPVALGGTAEVDVQLKVSTQSETVTVVADAPVVDSSTTAQVSTNYSREWIENAPVRRFTFFDLINAAPGVSPSTSTSSRSQSFGSATNENMYLLDGTDFTAPLTGAAWPWPNTDAIEEVQVLSLGAPADYGNLAGRGLQRRHAAGQQHLQGRRQLLLPDSGPHRPQYRRRSGRRSAVSPRRVQGHDHAAWWSSRQGPVLVFRVVSVPEGRRLAAWHATRVPRTVVGEAVLLQAELPDQPGQPAAVANARRLLPHSGARDVPPRRRARIGVETGHNPSPGLLWTSVINPSTVFEARYSGFYGMDHGDPLNGGPRVARRFNDLDTAQITGGIYSWYDGKSEKTAFSGKVTKYADKFMGGSHDFKLGVQYNSGLGEVHLRAERLYLHVRLDAGVRLHAVAVHAGRTHEGDRHFRRRHLSDRPRDAQPGHAIRRQQGILRRAGSA